MRDAAGQPSDGFHFLGLAELLFENAALGDVFGDDFEDFVGFAGCTDDAAAQADGDGVAIFFFPANFDAVEARRHAGILP